MDRRPAFDETRLAKRPKIQQSITKMFSGVGLKFTEVVGVQLLCPYCGHKFRAPQGLVAHKHMHERAGHSIGRPRRLCLKRSLTSSANKFPVQLVTKIVPKAEKKVCPSPPSPKVKAKLSVLPGVKPELMTRRFSVAEKLRIIDEAKKLNNISATCRWVKETFRRKTFACKSLTAMIAKEDTFRKSSGTKKIRKTVRQRTGLFPRMEKELAK